MDAPGLHPKLRRTLEAFDADGIEITPDQFAWLVTLRNKCDDPSAGAPALVVGSPLSVSGVDFYPMHRLADLWWLRINAAFEGRQGAQIFAFLFAHVRSAPGDTTLRGLMAPHAAMEAVEMWASDVPIHDSELTRICDIVASLDGDDESIPDPSAPEQEDDVVPQDSGARFAAIMCGAFPGCSPEFWLTGISSRDAIDMLDEGNGESFATGSHRTTAIANYLKAVKHVRASHHG